jgi:multiple sugar transport system ATP-binding protein
MTEYLIEAHGIERTFGTSANPVLVLRGLDLCVEAGTLVALYGPSGSGKTTLLSIMGCILRPTSGSLRVLGDDVTRFAERDLPAIRRERIGFVFQAYNLIASLTALENVSFQLELRGHSRAAAKREAADLLARVGLGEKLHQQPRQLSGGQRQRVALGRAIVRHPKVFLFDEPLSNLDAKLRVQMRGEIHRLHQRLKATMVYVTHDQVEAMTLGERIAVLKQGVLQQIADPDTLYRRPDNQFVAGFIGSPPMNFLAGVMDAHGAVTLAGETAFVPDGASAALMPRRGKGVTLGVRPEDFTLAPGAAGASIAATLDVREPLGNEELLYWTTAAGPVVSRLSGSRGPDEGARAALHFRFDRASWFDPESERALAHGVR